MSTICEYCDSVTSNRRPPVSCSGVCKKQYHAVCIGLPNEMASLFTSVPGLSWKCKACLNNEHSEITMKLQHSLEQKCSSILNEFSAKFESIKADITQIASDKFQQLSSSIPNKTPTYADKARTTSQPKLIVKPRNKDQRNQQTKSDVLNKVNPIDANIYVNTVKHISDGGIMLGCNSSTEINKFKNLAEEKLADDYIIREVKALQPRIRIVGISNNYNEETLVDYLFKQNPHIFVEGSQCKLLRLWPTKKNKNIFQAALQVDNITYNKVTKAGKVLIGLDPCAVYDAFFIPRCFKCNNFHHMSKFCKNSICCPLCAEQHDLKACAANEGQYKCSNCLNIKLKQNIDIDIKHAVWNYSKCYAYKHATEKLKSSLSTSTLNQ